MITAGEVLKKKRESLGKNLDTVSQDTKIQKRFLEYIEKNEFDRFESEVFLTGFIKIYSQHLNLDTEKVLALYRRSKPQITEKKEKKKKKDKTKEKKSFPLDKYLTPKTIISILTGIFIISILTYIGLQIYKFQSPPILTITEPIENTVVEKDTILVKGNTNPEAILEINEHLVEINEEGYFEKEINLNEGINTITVKAKKNSNNILETLETRKVTYNKPKEEQKTEEETPTQKNIVTLEISGAASWVRLDIDQINRISQVVQPSKQEFEVKENFYVISGRASNTFIYFNNEPVNWNNRNTTGVAEITCNVKNNNITCQ